VKLQSILRQVPQTIAQSLGVCVVQGEGFSRQNDEIFMTFQLDLRDKAGCARLEGFAAAQTEHLRSNRVDEFKSSRVQEFKSLRD
jgi:hypothetical protein